MRPNRTNFKSRWILHVTLIKTDFKGKKFSVSPLRILSGNHLLSKSIGKHFKSDGGIGKNGGWRLVVVLELINFILNIPPGLERWIPFNDKLNLECSTKFSLNSFLSRIRNVPFSSFCQFGFHGAQNDVKGHKEGNSNNLIK